MPLAVRSLLVALLTLASLALPLTPAHADSRGPRLLSAERLTPAEVGGGVPVTVAFTAGDDADVGSGVSYARFSYQNHDAKGGLLNWHEIDASGYRPLADGRALATRPLTPWAATGRYLLQSVSIWDHAGNITTYRRDGTVGVTPMAATAPEPSTLDFAALDFSVDNPQSDIGVPTIHELTLRTKTVRAGEPLVVTSSPDDDISGLGELMVSYDSPSGVTPLTAVADPVLAGAGLASAIVPLGAEGGTWRARLIYLRDRAGNSVFYYRDGGHTSYAPDGVRPHAAQPPIDFAALDVEIVPGTPDAEAPTISGLRREGPATLRRDDDVALSFVTSDQSELLTIDFHYDDSTGHSFTVMNQCRPERGIAVDTVPQGFDDGPVKLWGVTVIDALWNVRQYRRDGTVWTQGRTVADNVPGFDLSAFDFELVSGAPSYTGRQHTRFGCPTIPKLPVTLPDAAAPGTVVDVVGKVLSPLDVPLVDAAVGVFATAAGQEPELVGVAQTDGAGGYRVADVMPSSDTTYRVRFLGRDGVSGAQATTGTPQVVRAGSASTSASPAPSSPSDTGPTPAPAPSGSTAEPTPAPAPSGSTAEPTPAPAGPSSAPTGPSPNPSPSPTSADQPPAPGETAPPAPADQPPSLTLSPATISAGQPTTVTWFGTPGTTIDILSRTQPATAFSRIGSVTLNSNGMGTSVHRPQKNTRITGRSADGQLSPQAPLIAVRSVASLNVQRAGTRTYVFTGRVYPALANRLVNVYRNGTLVAQGRSDASGVYRITRTLARGTYDFQARTPNDGHNLGTRSPVRRVAVY